MLVAEIIAVGNELLLGDVLDTNTHWLCRQVTGLGGRVSRGCMVPDSAQAIAEALLAALGRQPDLVVLTGGLGPTADDQTLASVAATLDRPLGLSSTALRMVQETYEELAAQGLVREARLTDVRSKMAHLPSGAVPLPNPVGAAPGVLMRQGQAMIVCLPGVPAELKAIFLSFAQTHLATLLGSRTFLEWTLVTDCGDESILAPEVNRVATGHPHVYVKSRAQAYGDGVPLRVTLSASGDEPTAVEAWIESAKRDLIDALAVNGIEVVEAVQNR